MAKERKKYRGSTAVICPRILVVINGEKKERKKIDGIVLEALLMEVGGVIIHSKYIFVVSSLSIYQHKLHLQRSKSAVYTPRSYTFTL